jgi:hypothetical protein
MDQSEYSGGQSVAASFDTIDHAYLQHFLDERVTDGGVRKMIDTWLKRGGARKGHPTPHDWRNAARSCDLAAALEYLPALCAG